MIKSLIEPTRAKQYDELKQVLINYAASTCQARVQRRTLPLEYLKVHAMQSCKNDLHNYCTLQEELSSCDILTSFFLSVERQAGISTTERVLENI